MHDLTRGSDNFLTQGQEGKLNYVFTLGYLCLMLKCVS